MKKIKFRLVPFIISVAIVVGSVAGIMLYSYHGYDNNKLRFVADYFHYEDYKEVSTEEQIENYIKMTTHAYKKVDSGLKYYDINSKKEYNATPSSSSKNHIEGATFENGVLHLPGYFDLAMYAESLWNVDSKEWVFSYYIYLYNVNYKKANIIDNLYFCFVNGTGESGENELFGTTKLDMVIEEVKNGENGTPNGVNLPSFQYTGKVSSSYTMYIHDNNATGNGVNSDNIPFVYRLTSLQESPAESSELDDDYDFKQWFCDLDSATFSIFYSGDDDLATGITNGTTDELEEIVRGTYVNQYKNVEEFNDLAKNNEQNINLGYEQNLTKAGYFKFIIGRLLIEGAVTLVVSGILATLFYLIWQEEPEENYRPKRIKAPKPKRK